ncbi:TonB-dependent vitamin B12 receptor BtuB [Citrobacter portucalensis]|uniref:Vitamin B12 transporter BtuB n=1 Tax=Citrobacter portucalensis TaxID=1639133 RepID=A0AAJ1JRK7_9ENTR|nr:MULTISPECIES: TonB-dependent vitamin B12 receptor BtuB [Citrobacter]EHA3710709.1 TonB-dependent vitamin B12 receptor BtuB [Citrobacter freundii]SAE46367.1 vitamin B12/cobalamin outer membrane transporter [Enterobacter cloacae]EHL86749.1 TonB-dependent vitamin B12 receptor [Citrobacter portucalensis]EHU7377157.1 TonB-dependent vitamin B12 receptor BtuB [Citrobacter freundii]EJD6668844.1 TonB-dependent vitamin B12 receptor BtuB [Citrobacter freundii]
MIKKSLLCTALSVTAFSGWAQDTSPDTLVVTANRFQQPVNTVLAPTEIVTREDIDRWQSKDLTDVMRRLPGVDVAQNGGMGQSSNIYIRGAEARHTLVLIDGIPLAKSGITGIADFSQIPLSLIQRIEMIRGPRSAVYGADAIGGVINIITQNTQPGGKVQVGVGSNHYQQYDASLRQELGEDTLATIAGSFTDTKGYNVQPDSSYSGDSDRDGFRNKTFWAGVTHKFTDELSAFVRGYGYSNNTDYDAGYKDGGDEHQVYNHTYETGLAWNNDFYSTQLTGSYQKYKDYNYSSTQGLYQAGTTLDDMTQKNVQWGNSFIVGKGTVSAGIDWQQQKLTSVDTYNSNDYKRDNTGYYLTAQQKVDTVTLEGALRGDDNEQFGWNGTWQTAVGWEFVPDYQVTISYGTGFQAPTLGQMYGQSRLYITPNPNLEAEKSGQFEVGLQGLTGPVNWRLAAYQNKIKNLIDYYSPDNGMTGVYYNTQSATIKGVELTGDFDTGPVTHRISMGYLDPRRDSDNEVLAHRSRQQYKYQLDWTMLGFDMDLSYQYYGKSYNNNSNQFSSTQRRMPSYSLLDISASYPITSQLTVRGKIANLFDKDYETVYGYATAGREYTLSGSYTF